MFQASSSVHSGVSQDAARQFGIIMTLYHPMRIYGTPYHTVLMWPLQSPTVHCTKATLQVQGSCYYSSSASHVLVPQDLVFDSPPTHVISPTPPLPLDLQFPRGRYASPLGGGGALQT